MIIKRNSSEMVTLETMCHSKQEPPLGDPVREIRVKLLLWNLYVAKYVDWVSRSWVSVIGFRLLYVEKYVGVSYENRNVEGVTCRELKEIEIIFIMPAHQMFLFLFVQPIVLDNLISPMKSCRALGTPHSSFQASEISSHSLIHCQARKFYSSWFLDFLDSLAMRGSLIVLANVRSNFGCLTKIACCLE